jgi:hypothetical protein
MAKLSNKEAEQKQQLQVHPALVFSSSIPSINNKVAYNASNCKYCYFKNYGFDNIVKGHQNATQYTNKN